MDLIEQLLETWKTALADLGVPPNVERRGNAVWLSDFGGPQGMLCSFSAVVGNDFLPGAAEAIGASYSHLGRMYMSYDRALYIEMLNDWGWFGAGSPPDWFTG